MDFVAIDFGTPMRTVVRLKLEANLLGVNCKH